MKVKTSGTLSEKLLQAIDGLDGPYKNRSDFLEKAAWALLACDELVSLPKTTLTDYVGRLSYDRPAGSQ